MLHRTIADLKGQVEKANNRVELMDSELNTQKFINAQLSLKVSISEANSEQEKNQIATELVEQVTQWQT